MIEAIQHRLLDIIAGADHLKRVVPAAVEELSHLGQAHLLIELDEIGSQLEQLAEGLANVIDQEVLVGVEGC